MYSNQTWKYNNLSYIQYSVSATINLPPLLFNLYPKPLPLSPDYLKHIQDNALFHP